MNDDVKSFVGCFLVFASILLAAFGWGWYSTWSKEREEAKRIEIHRQDSIRKAFIADSLAHDPHYQDSLRIENERWEKWRKEDEEIMKKELVGFFIPGDTVYHSTFHPMFNSEKHFYGYMLSDRANLRFITWEEAERDNLLPCSICEETEEVRMRYDDGELFDYESAFENDLIPIEDADNYCSHGDN